MKKIIIMIMLLTLLGCTNKTSNEGIKTIETSISKMNNEIYSYTKEVNTTNENKETVTTISAKFNDTIYTYTNDSILTVNETWYTFENNTWHKSINNNFKTKDLFGELYHSYEWTSEKLEKNKDITTVILIGKSIKQTDDDADIYIINKAYINKDGYIIKNETDFYNDQNYKHLVMKTTSIYKDFNMTKEEFFDSKEQEIIGLL